MTKMASCLCSLRLSRPGEVEGPSREANCAALGGRRESVGLDRGGEVAQA